MLDLLNLYECSIYKDYSVRLYGYHGNQQLPKPYFSTPLDDLLSALTSILEANKPGNAAYCLAKLVRYVINSGVDYPMTAEIWVHDDLKDIAEEISTGKARAVFSHFG